MTSVQEIFSAEIEYPKRTIEKEERYARKKFENIVKTLDFWV